MITRIFIASVFIFFVFKSQGQTNDDFLFLNKELLKKNLISEIKDLTNLNSNSIDDTITYRLFIFDKGIIKVEAIVSDLYEDLEHAIFYGYHYLYTDSSYSKILQKEGNGDAGMADQHYFSDYKYLNNKLKLIIDGSYYRPEDNGDFVHLINSTKYFYNDNGTPAYKVFYGMGEKSATVLGYTNDSLSTILNNLY